MAVQGTSKKISLLKMAQLICVEKHQMALSLKHWQKEGVIYFHEGEIIHAHSGLLIGEEAVVQLLTLPGGTFKLNSYDQVPPRTVNMSWHDIVSLRKKFMASMDDLGGDNSATMLADKIKPDQEADLEDDLIILLSQLEYTQSQIIRDKNKWRINDTLITLIDMVNQVVQCANPWLNPEQQMGTLTTARDIVGKHNTDGIEVSIQDNQLEARSLARSVDKLVRELADPQALQHIAQSLIDLVEKHLLLLVDRFSSFSLVDQWRDTCQEFLLDTQRVLELTD